MIPVTALSALFLAIAAALPATSPGTFAATNIAATNTTATGTRKADITTVTPARLNAVTFAVTCTAAAPDDLFDVQNRPARRAVVLVPGRDAPADVPGSKMLRRLVGVIDVLSKSQLAAFRRAVDADTRVPRIPEISQRLAVLYLYAEERPQRPGQRPRRPRRPSTNLPTTPTRIEINRVGHGWIIARSLDTGDIARLDARLVDPILSRWDQLPTSPDDGIAPGETVELPSPYIPSPIRLDPKTIADRFSRGGRPIFSEPMSRRLADERFIVRRPADHNPDRPAGLLVWISPTDNAGLPDQILPATDGLGLIVISPTNAGNDRPAVDRLQLALDAVATAADRWWIDPDRVYIAGMSGGGRIASMLWACFPDIFTGGVGVVGMNSDRLIGIGDGRFWPKGFSRPAGPLGRAIADHRFAAISGPRDFNFNEIRARITHARRDGLHARLFDFADQTHAMPTPEHFTQALTWVHQRYLDNLAERTEKADRLLNAYKAKYGDTPPTNNRARRMLERVTVVGPWTQPAWHAAELLGYAKAAASPADPGSPPDSSPETPPGSPPP